MKSKHMEIRTEQCLLMAQASSCPKMKSGAMLLDPSRNVVLMDGYNGGPRGADGLFCGGHFCERDGLTKKDFFVVLSLEHDTWGKDGWSVIGPGIRKFFLERSAADAFVSEMLARYPEVKPGTHSDIGCHHAEANVICNAAANGVRTKGAMLIMTGSPCWMSAKLIHHAGISQVVVVKGDSTDDRKGLEYLERNGVHCVEVDSPRDVGSRPD